MTTEPLINRKTGSSKIYINQKLIYTFYKRVIFRAIELKVAFRNFYPITPKFLLIGAIMQVKVRGQEWGSNQLGPKFATTSEARTRSFERHRN